jgi:hypothetical protein
VGKALEKAEVSLYEQDFYAWLMDQAEKLRARSHNDIDWENLAEEVEDVGRSQKHQLGKRLGVLLMHLLKWEHQPNRRSHSWQTTISEQRIHIAGLIEISPSLGRYPAETMEWSYGWARRRAAYETGLPIATFPEQSPYAAEQALEDTFMPGEPWSPDDLIRD